MPLQLQTNATNALRSVKSYFKDFGISLTDAEDLFIYVLDIRLEDLLLGDHQLTNSNKQKIQEISTWNLSVDFNFNVDFGDSIVFL